MSHYNRAMVNVAQKIMMVIADSSHPLLASDIQSKINDCDRATIYRNLNKLKEKQLVRIIEIGDGAVRYESTEDHHHHLICLKCKEMTRVDLPEKDEKRIEKLQSEFQDKSKFSFLTHSLEFFGLCIDCINK